MPLHFEIVRYLLIPIFFKAFLIYYTLLTSIAEHGNLAIRARKQRVWGPRKTTISP